MRVSRWTAFLMIGLVSACARPLPALTAAPVATAQVATARKSGLALDPAKLKVVALTNRYMEVSGDAGAIAAGDGVWMSFGRQVKPVEGWERPANADGSFKPIVLDLKVPEAVTFWAWHDEGDKRMYGTPVVVPIAPVKAAGAPKQPK